MTTRKKPSSPLPVCLACNAPGYVEAQEKAEWYCFFMFLKNATSRAKLNFLLAPSPPKKSCLFLRYPPCCFRGYLTSYSNPANCCNIVRHTCCDILQHRYNMLQHIETDTCCNILWHIHDMLRHIASYTWHFVTYCCIDRTCCYSPSMSRGVLCPKMFQNVVKYRTMSQDVAYWRILAYNVA